MKKLIYGGVFIGALFITTLNSCSKTDYDSPNSESSYVENEFKNGVSSASLHDSIGFYHNLYISEFLRENQEEFSGSKELINEFLEFITDNYPEVDLAVNEHIDEINNFRYNFDFPLDSANMNNYLHAELARSYANGRISEYLYNQYKLMVNNPTPTYVRSVMSEIENKSGLSERDSLSFRAFSNVYDASSELWPEMEITYGLDPSVQGMIGDAVGAAMWWWTGPVGALIAGGYSIACYYS